MPKSSEADLFDRLEVFGEQFDYVSLGRAERAGLGEIEHLPRARKVLAEGILRRGGDSVTKELKALAGTTAEDDRTISFGPGRALLQDFMGIPLMTDLASMRDNLRSRGSDPNILNPQIPVDFVVDHSLVVYHSASADAINLNRRMEFERNHERFEFLKWCEGAFDNLRFVPPGTGIMHQVNLELLAKVVSVTEDDSGRRLAIPDTMIGTDSHTTMINGLGVLGWGVGGIEAEAAILGFPLTMQSPKVVGLKLEGCLRTGVTATDLVLHMTQFLREVGVVGAIVEFHGDGVASLPIADRATLANMSPEFGATCCYFPIDDRTIEYLRMSGREEAHLALVEGYCRAQGLWQEPVEDHARLAFDSELAFDLSSVEPCVAGPTRPQDRVALGAVPQSFEARRKELKKNTAEEKAEGPLPGDGAVVIAAITSCTNTSNPAVMIAAGLLARNAVARGLQSAPWVKTSMAPGSQVVADYLKATGLQPGLDALGFQIIGYGCATCNGNSGPLAPDISAQIEEHDTLGVAVLSGNRNFEGRIHPQVKAAYLGSPPLVVAYAIAGDINRDLTKEPVGHDPDGKPVFLSDLWPDAHEIEQLVSSHVKAELFENYYERMVAQNPLWRDLKTSSSATFPWRSSSPFISRSPFPDLSHNADFLRKFSDLRPLVVLGDSITTDHIAPNGAISPRSPAGKYLISLGEKENRLGNYGARRGNAEVCHRGMFDNHLLRNELMADERGNTTKHFPSGEQATIFEIAATYCVEGTGTVVVAGQNYGAGSSRDWAAKGLRLLGVKGVLTESFERIHRANLVLSGVVPLLFPEGVDRRTLNLDGTKTLSFHFAEVVSPRAPVHVVLLKNGEEELSFVATLAIDTKDEVAALLSGGILPLIGQQFGSEPGRIAL